jgi:hypothetical protein
MPNEGAPFANPAAALIPPVVCNHPDDVSEVRVESGHRLHVRFFDGVCGIVDLSALIASPNAGVFAALRDESLFATATVVLGAVTWANGLDLAPDAMHDALSQTGMWTVHA